MREPSRGINEDREVNVLMCDQVEWIYCLRLLGQNQFTVTRAPQTVLLTVVLNLQFTAFAEQ